MSDQLHEMQRNIANFELQRWLNDGVFTWTWWYIFCVLVIPWCIFFKLVDRKRTHSIWLFGLMVMIITSFTDDIGSDIGIWVYPIEFFPFSLIEFPFDCSTVPVAQMLIFQYFTKWKSFSMALVLQALIFAFIGEPFSVWVDAVTYYGWTYFYSFIFYIFTGTFSKAFVSYWTPKQCSGSSRS
ncbi:CBO0543 family protein [Paenibacillus sp. V4I5]|uniref:CBO0543 family protein n=1 Tax=Paenibacillus sp. V4I5 TaxID=3042306 RepID=UPI002793F6C1|nr:CBO0543 family protein [Paenibacillus sp. V4I5]MDQ0914700.1 hypothetical protein [Paenibacillus sp. V4I5]